MPLFKHGRPAPDPYAFVADEAPLPEGPVIVGLKRFRAERETLLAREAPLGVRLASDQSPEGLWADVEKLSLVVLEFANFRDGRPFSWARLLRTRLGFKGEIRAAGDFLYDQLAFLGRTGFDAFDWPGSEAEARRALTEMSSVFQPAADGRKTAAALRQEASKAGTVTFSSGGG